MDSVMEYHLKPLGRTCASTGRELAPGSLCHSVLFERDGEFVRLDYSDDAWTGPPLDAVAHWCSLVPYPALPKKRPLDPNSLLSCFEELMADPDPMQEDLHYILAILLVRHKKLRLDPPQEDVDEFLTLSHVDGTGIFSVRNLQLSDSELIELQKKLSAHLMVEWSRT